MSTTDCCAGRKEKEHADEDVDDPLPLRSGPCVDMRVGMRIWHLSTGGGHAAHRWKALVETVLARVPARAWPCTGRAVGNAYL